MTEATGRKRIMRISARAVFFTAVLWLCAFLLIRNLSGIIRTVTGEDSTIAAVFSQLKTARIRPAVLAPLAAWAAFFFLSDKFGLKPLPRCLIAVLLWLVLFFAVLWFTRVNGIRFGSVVKSLLTYISNGLLEQL